MKDKRSKLNSRNRQIIQIEYNREIDSRHLDFQKADPDYKQPLAKITIWQCTHA